MGLVTAAVIHGGESGWRSPVTIGFLLAGLARGSCILARPRAASASRCCRRSSSPTGVRTVAVICASLMGFLFYGTLFLMSLYFQELRGWRPGSTGVALLPLTVGTLAGPFLIYRRCRHGLAIRCCWSPASPAARWASACLRRLTPTVHTARSRRAAADRRRQHRLLLRADIAAARECHRGAIGSRLRCAEHHPASRRADVGIDPRGCPQRPSDRRSAPNGVRRARRRRAPRHRRVGTVAQRWTSCAAARSRPRDGARR